MDEEELLDPDVQMIIQESSQKECYSANLRSDALKLVKAIKKGDVSMLREHQHFPDVFQQVDERGWYPLHWAAVQPLLSILETVLYASFSLSLEEQTLEGETFLTLAVKAGLVENVRMLLHHGASCHTTNRRNESPLLLAVRAGSLQMVSCLIAHGARVNQVCLRKWTAMHEACQVGCVPVMELLLQSRGQVMETDQHGVTPLGIAAEYRHPEVMALLIKHGSGNLDCIDILLQHGANANIQNLSFQLPIHRAAYEGHWQALQILIPITTRRALRLSGQSPVHSAADGGHVHCLQLLLKNGFDVNAMLAPHVSENYGDMRRSPLFFTVSNGDTTCTEILLKSGAKADLDPLCCLLVAVRSGRYEIVKQLLAAGANVNCYFTMLNDTVFPTALQYCLKDEVMMRMLLSNGYDAVKCFLCNHSGTWDDVKESGSIHQETKLPFCEFVSASWMVNLVGTVVLILLDYVGQVSLCGKLRLMLEKHEEWPVIDSIITNPRPLSHLSRLVFRGHVGLSALKSQQLPYRLRNYLLFKENDLYSKLFS
ncbi:ankyrin repeat and SOCS box protein 15 isoform X2 [Gouania willdenowi]|uniref:ankyrin repeat and SOCS box protein 15 isoform X2 n=1 Tax=Gouania willdenowi TaxID=441366 RepID=UPI001056D940|nr:ankyrin repeat and SOCS box protein 15 isoform X2 [Gouania willdenowi]